MKKLMLNDILQLSEDEIRNSKIGLNMQSQGKTHFQNWYDSDEDHRNTDFAYWPYIGKQRNFTYIGEWLFAFVRLEDDADRWLLVSVGEITSLPKLEEWKACEHKEIDRFQGLVGRLIIKVHRGNKFSRYVFNLEKYIYEAEVSEIVPHIYEPINFNGYENVHISYKTLKYILTGEGDRYHDYRAALKGVQGIYCLTDKKEGKCYIGSASGSDGILQRWTNYVDSKTGGNQALIELYNEKGDAYFEENFEYSILETFNKNVDQNKVLKRESYWKDIFKTRENGYNRN